MARKATGSYVGWEEVVVSSDKGRREVHYYLRDAGGGLDLAVVGRERSARHMSYDVPARFARPCGSDTAVPARASPTRPSSSLSSLSCASTVTSGTTAGSCSSPSPPPSSSSAGAGALSLKWRSRREVIDWLSSIVSAAGSSLCSIPLGELRDDEDRDTADCYTLKGISSEKMRHHSKGFLWLGSSWTCRKQKKHYSSFCRYGITVSLHDFVYVMSEENKRLVAYIEDMYEDLKARKMVVVRWFHKIDEVNIVLPPDVNDREIFFSLCLQDLVVECIDGLAAVLSALHFDKYLNEAVHDSPWKPFLCCRQIDNEDVKPFDITQMQGYWQQEVLKCMYAYPKLHLKSAACSISTSNDDTHDNTSNDKPKRKNRILSVENSKGSIRLKFSRVGDATLSRRHPLDCYPPVPLPPKKNPMQKIQQQLPVGCHVEVLSQDSGLRGCWFRCVILKRHQDKVKVKYEDLQDADGKSHLMEWILASRVAVVDTLGIWSRGRNIVRPQPSPMSKISPVLDVGTVVDVWWHDGWWEGIVISKDTGQKLCVYFPGEQRTSFFGPNELRQSLDWSCNRWNVVRERPDLASSLLFDITRENNGKDAEGLRCTIPQVSKHSEIKLSTVCLPGNGKTTSKVTYGEEPLPLTEEEAVPDLALDEWLVRLKWSSSRKRCPRGFPGSRRNLREDVGRGISSSHDSPGDSMPCMKCLVTQALMPDNKCKFRGGDPFFNDSTAISSLVVSR